jgi:peptidoglycan/LPS O-acetylase OafA/YrhL
MIRPYRKDIDGLRAIAVTSVIAFHAQWTLFGGGFVGVDVFFVISGYLIGSMIIDDVSAGRFSLVGFYERRIRRILPALAVMMVATSVLAYLYMLPNELERYADSLLAATFSVSNFYFARNSGYFMPAATTFPLLHTWSLAIEEQFYIFLPLFVLLVHRLWRRGLWPALLVATLLSLAFSIGSAFQGPSSDFYMPQLRAWELLLGSLIAWNRLPALTSRLQREAASLLGIVLMVVAATTFVSWTPFPGYAALVPCLGAALVIAAGRSGDSFVARGLSLPPLVFLGRISYSLYLWHWPIFVFIKMSENFPAEQDKTVIRLLAVAATLVAATLSWRYVETPFRSGPWRPSRRRLFTAAAGAVVLLGGIGLGFGLLQGLPNRFSPTALAILAQMQRTNEPDNYFRSGACFLDREDKVDYLTSKGCLQTDPSRPNYLLIGDSYAAHLWYGLSHAFDKINVMQATAAGCTPLPERKFTRICNGVMRFLFSDYLLHHKPDRLVLSAEWLPADLPQLAQVLDWATAHDIRVILMGPIMRYDDRLPAFAIEEDNPDLPDAHRLDYRALDQSLRELAHEKGATYVSLLDLLCKEAVCETLAGPGVPLQFDDGHLTKAGSLLVGERLRTSGAFTSDLAEAK